MTELDGLIGSGRSGERRAGLDGWPSSSSPLPKIIFYFTPLLLFESTDEGWLGNMCNRSKPKRLSSFLLYFWKAFLKYISTNWKKFIIYVFWNGNFFKNPTLEILGQYPRKTKMNYIDSLKKFPFYVRYIYVYTYTCACIYICICMLCCVYRKKKKEKKIVAGLWDGDACFSPSMGRGDAITSCAHPIQYQPPAFLITTTKFLQVQDKHLKEEFIQAFII